MGSDLKEFPINLWAQTIIQGKTNQIEVQELPTSEQPK